jgi:hypothetical protein
MAKVREIYSSYRLKKNDRKHLKGKDLKYRSLEEMPEKEKIRKIHNYCIYDHKYNWSMISRFLGSRVGQSWDNVFSELSDLINSNRLLRKIGIKETISWTVVINVQMINKKPFHKQLNGDSGPVAVVSRGKPRYYVNPETGLLCEAPHLTKTND